ncbi:hypothetical protein KCU77_g3108, partial [Aureobasidium melanogenum]
MADHVFYVSPTLRQMRDALKNDGISALLNCITEETDGISSEAEATMLLAQVAPEMIRSILSNTPPADVASGRVILQLWAEITLKPQHEDNLEPGVYVNFLAPLDGSPLSLYEFSRFLEGLETAVWGSRMLDETDVCRLVEGSDLVQDLNDFLSENKSRLEDARAQNATHMAILPHCGSARNIHSACKEHYNFKAPTLFSLARCVLGALFPDKHFRYGGFNFPPHEDLDAAETETETEQGPEINESDWLTVCDRYITLLDKFDPLLAESRRHSRFGSLMELRLVVQAFNEKLEDDIKQLDLARFELRQKSYTPRFTATNRQELKILDQEMVAHQALKHLTVEEGEKLDRALDDLSSRFTEAGSEAEMQRLTGGLVLGRPSF